MIINLATNLIKKQTLKKEDIKFFLKENLSNN